MAEFYMGQIMLTGFGFAQKSFAQCNGQIMAISQNAALFSLLGTTYGGDGARTFALPNLASRSPAGGGFPSADAGWQPTPYPLGLVAGTETVTLMTPQIPAHTHGVSVTSVAARGPYPSSTATLAAPPAGNALYGPLTTPVALAPQALAPAGGNQPHTNIQPYLAINFNIALYGIFPSQG